jgi:hypothetical protein
MLQLPYDCIHKLLSYLHICDRGALSCVSKAHRKLLPPCTIGIAHVFGMYLVDLIIDRAVPYDVYAKIARRLLPSPRTRERHVRRLCSRYCWSFSCMIHPRYFSSRKAWFDHHFLPDGIHHMWVDKIYALPRLYTYGAPSRYRSIKALL